MVSAAGFWRIQGTVGLAGALAGLALGGGTAALGNVLRRKARRAQGQAMVQALMLATISSFTAFIGAAVAVALFWREAATPVLVSALGLYLTVLFHGVAQGRS
jgi:hypothetical protein